MILRPVKQGAPVRLDGDHAKLSPKKLPGEKAMKKETADLLDRFEALQAALYAEGKRSLLVVLQARDAGGKDGLIRKVFGAPNPQGCEFHSFKAPSDEERRHDYLWRVHRAAPPHGIIGVFNRSHYEDVLVPRVRALIAEDEWKRRYVQINDFERMLSENGTTIVKFFLHISRAEQRERLVSRLEDPEKNWKFNPDDLEDRARWRDFTEAYRDLLSECSTPHAPWYIVPADDKSVRNYLVAQVMVDTLERMAPKYPRADEEVLRLMTQIE